MKPKKRGRVRERKMNTLVAAIGNDQNKVTPTPRFIIFSGVWSNLLNIPEWSDPGIPLMPD